MALARAHTWNPGDILRSADLNGEFNNILNNAIALISPTTGAINFNLSTHYNLLPVAISASSGTAGQALVVSGTETVWGNVAAGAITTGTISAGAILYFSTAATPLLDTLPIGTSGLILTVSTAGKPSWVAIGSVVGGVTVLDAATANVTVINTTAETTIYTFSVPGGTLGSSGQLRLTIQGQERIAANSHRTRLKFGSAIVGDTLHNAVAIGSDTPHLLSGLVSAKGTAASQISMLSEEVVNSNTIIYMTKAIGLSTMDTTAAVTLAVTLEWEVASTGNSYTMERATLEKLI